MKSEDEIVSNYFKKYEHVSLEVISRNENDLNNYVIHFCKDLTQLGDILSRRINLQKHANGYSLNEATIVGSITRIVKLYQQAVFFYEQDKQEIFMQFFRPMFESFVIVKYLIKRGEESQRNFRLVSYRTRYENFKKLSEIKYKNHRLAQRLLGFLNAKLKRDGFTIDDLESEHKKKHKAWKLDGKSFWKIHSEVEREELYSFSYGVGSDSVHGSWQEILEFHLAEIHQGYMGFLDYSKCDCGLIVPFNSIVIESLWEFLKWNESMRDGINTGLKNLKALNNSLSLIWEGKFRGK